MNAGLSTTSIDHLTLLLCIPMVHLLSEEQFTYGL